ncbi:recombinase family protein [Gammaproteobacteria bacterium]|nr:recombinase family protein [Gammaproteobacteria bacterium]
MNYLDCYTRVSTAEQKKTGNSLVVQRDMGKKVAKKLGLKFRHRDEGSRSSTIHYREVLEQLKTDIEKGLVKNIWCQDRSRMFRDMTDGLLFRRDFIEKYDVTVYEGELPTQIDFNNEDESVMYDIITRLQQYENKKRLEKSQRGKIAKLKDAVASNKSVYMGGSALFGYKNVNKQWKINKEEEKWVKWIFQAYEDGKSVKQLKNHLDKNGVSTRRTKSGLWNMATIQKMLINKTYTGIHTVKIDKIKREFSFKVDKIISVSQFNRVQKKISFNQRMKDNNKKHKSLLSDFLVCECGTTMSSEIKIKNRKDGTVIKTRKYFCMNKNYQWRDGIDRGCVNKKSLDMDRTDTVILDRVKKVVSDSHILREKTKQSVLDSKSQIEKNIIGERERLEDKCQRIQKTIDNIENQIVDLEVDMGLGKKDKSIANKIIKRYEDELLIQHEEYKSVENELDGLNENLVWVDWVEKFSEQLDISTKSSDKKKEFLEGLLSKIIVQSEMGLNRNGEEVQVGHSFDIRFKMKIVNDKIIWNDESDKRKGYNLKDGRNIFKTGLVNEVTAKAGRVWSKKKQ